MLRASYGVLLLLLCFCACIGAETAHKRQKRGLMKMMMHIMWDPVRLIRYWYAYDVSKEIAKSWRKIIPTVLLMPFSPHPFAKYVHPNAGLRTEPHKQLGSSSYLDAVRPPPHMQQTEGQPYDYRDANHFALQPYPFVHSSERKDPPYSVELSPDWLKDLPFKLMQLPSEMTEDSSSENVPKIPYQGPVHKVRTAAAVSKVIPHDRPEVHIVLHPIPVKDPERFRKSGYRIVPVQQNDPLPFPDPAQDHAPDTSYAHNETSFRHFIADHNISSSELYSPPDEAAASAPHPTAVEEAGQDQSGRSVRVDLRRLREELKHGTPVLIPYDDREQRPLKRRKCEDEVDGEGKRQKVLLLLTKKKDT